LDFELRVAGVQREGEGVCFAGFDGAGEEVEGEEFHFVGGGDAIFWGCKVDGSKKCGGGDAGMFFLARVTKFGMMRRVGWGAAPRLKFKLKSGRDGCWRSCSEHHLAQILSGLYEKSDTMWLGAMVSS
jgi:hypothetical protein